MSGNRAVFADRGVGLRPTRAGYSDRKKTLRYSTVNRVEDQLALLMMVSLSFLFSSACGSTPSECTELSPARTGVRPTTQVV
jgi:hypothetical protein